MEEKFGIDNLKKVVNFGVAIKNWYTAANSDNKIELTEVFALLPQLMAIPNIVSSGEAILQEAKDLSFAEVQDLISGISGATTENVLGIITDSLNLIVAIKNLVGRVA